MAPRLRATFGRRGAPPRAAAQPQASSPPPAMASPSRRDARETLLELYDDETLMARFIGPDWPEYQDLWRLMRFDGALIPSFSFPALLVPFAWLFYRRLYVAGLATTAWQIAMIRLSLFDSMLGGLLMCLFFGAFGKALVVRKGMKAVKAIRDGDPARIGTLGGASLLPAVVAFIVVAAFSLVELMEPLAQLFSPDSSLRPAALSELLDAL